MFSLVFIIVYPIILCMKYIYAVCFLLLVCGCHKENDTLLFYLHGHYWFIWEEIIILMPKPMTNLFKLKMDGKTGQMEI